MSRGSRKQHSSRKSNRYNEDDKIFISDKAMNDMLRGNEKRRTRDNVKSKIVAMESSDDDHSSTTDTISRDNSSSKRTNDSHSSSGSVVRKRGRIKTRINDDDNVADEIKTNNDKEVKIVKITSPKRGRKPGSKNKKQKITQGRKANNSSAASVRLTSDGYVRPKKTATDMLSIDDIKKRIRNFERVNNEEIKDILVNTRIQYFELSEDDGFRYKPGGVMIVNKYPDYIVLANGRKTWCVQLDKHVIYKEIDVEKITAKHDAEMDKLREQLDAYRNLLRGRYDEIEQLKKELKRIKRSKY
jgi:hypothetical protein